MKLLLALSALALCGPAAARISVRRRLMYNLKTWVQGAAHCAEFATEGAEIDLDKANECRRCYAKIGDWGTEAGFAQGQECLNTYEPSFTELCGEKMTAFQESGFESEDAQREVDECWEEALLRRIAEKCVEVKACIGPVCQADPVWGLAGGNRKHLGGLCVIQHITQNMEYAKLKVYGEAKRKVIHKPTNYENMLQSVFEEGYCESANPGNKDREAECMMCFDYVRTEANKMWEELDNTAEQVDTAAMRMMFAQYMFCADTYLAPVYSDCFENIDDLITHIEDNNQEEWGKKLLEDQGCMLLKQSQYYFQDCADGAGDGVDGLLNYVHCSRNTTATWVKNKRPEAADVVHQFMSLGGNWMPMDGECRGCSGDYDL